MLNKNLLSILLIFSPELAAQKLEFSDYEIEVYRSNKETVQQHMDSLLCKNYQTGKKPYKFANTIQYSSSAKTQLLNEIAASLTTEISIDTHISSFKYAIDTHLKAQRSIAHSKVISQRFTLPVEAEIQRLKCFDITVLLLHEEEVTQVNGTDYKWFNEEFDFELYNITDWRFRFEATFNPNCNADCKARIPSGFKAVVDLNGNSYSIQVTTLDGWVYTIPLYRNNLWEFGKVTNFLPSSAAKLLLAQPSSRKTVHEKSISSFLSSK